MEIDGIKACALEEVKTKARSLGDFRDLADSYAADNDEKVYDVLVAVNDCGHNVWQNSEKADKAKKGLERPLRDHSQWKSLMHCGSCTGGGMWKVQW